ncbi:MAG TPA: hypothetical protein VJV04_14135 [Nitrospiraceae bacterium]|nr:hypothetical protein [Nitrospiraceae bacterium]
MDESPKDWKQSAAEPAPQPLIPFEPAQLRARHDGWTAKKQIAFIEALAECGIVDEACRRVGMSDTSAYELRRRSCGAQFRRAWDAAIEYSEHRAYEAARERVIKGVARPVFYKGEQVGEYRHFDERLTIYMLHTRTRRPAHLLNPLPPLPSLDEEPYEDDPADILDAEIEELAERAPDEDGNPSSDWLDER